MFGDRTFSTAAAKRCQVFIGAWAPASVWVEDGSGPWPMTARVPADSMATVSTIEPRPFLLNDYGSFARLTSGALRREAVGGRRRRRRLAPPLRDSQDQPGAGNVQVAHSESYRLRAFRDNSGSMQSRRV
ncbi:hypothetical protein EVAR_12448_1 [Eumeta japonica]|uniref:Uncharacterized protein n=1 Tax=Eumeta variegata TaxID=151549 RepID=A0A4C1U0R5_EUMVA|nr:hypothetical protein EVAR_12448_1 [Eumeta japonica]